MRLKHGLMGALLVAVAAMSSVAATAAEPLKEIRLGFQKTSLPVIAQQQKLVEKSFEKDGVAVRWVEFAAGPPLVEALNVGSIDLGWTGDAPPIFGQAAGANFVYVAALPSNGAGEAIFVKPDSPIKTLADLKGKKVGVTKGSSAQNLLAAALEKAGVPYAEITPVYLSPADAGAAFASDKIDAWAVWDPFFAIAETRFHPRVLTTTKAELNVNTYFLANKTFAAEHPAAVTTVIDDLKAAAAWADANRDKVAEALHEVTGVPLEAQTIAANRQVFGIYPLTPEIIAEQQKTADRFASLGLIPKKIVVTEAVWTPPSGN
ncbi:sulfonate transport system substrate-binding protein [Pseudoxanthobacter soli DSM 19599]|uniref:Putative aliphatic sulfonates-binding protein n=1 Tax=Pseudoxanthobacter soli DSM 19599 TaxID=1123029 RepID=A0A1M7ZKV5_9HYPH|nr:sulfonate transport system substrate-binding protein [Pseudoxanthobacter soli DSM 19599]